MNALYKYVMYKAIFFATEYLWVFFAVSPTGSVGCPLFGFQNLVTLDKIEMKWKR